MKTHSGYFRKKPVVVAAVLWTGYNGLEVANFTYQRIQGNLAPIQIKTLEGTMTADVGDWIVRGVKGEYYPVKPDIFEATYEPTDDRCCMWCGLEISAEDDGDICNACIELEDAPPEKPEEGE